MGTHVYKVDGKRVPSVTTIIGILDKPALFHWAAEMGLKGIDPRTYRDDKADVGTIAHAMIEAHLLGQDPVSKGHAVCKDKLLWPEAETAFGAYLKWRESFEVRVVATEIKMESALYRCGGCPDLVGFAGDELRLFDWKTSGGIYDSHVIQVAAYVGMWNERHPGDIIRRAHILRFDRETGEYAHHEIDQRRLSYALELFAMLRNVYDTKKIVDRDFRNAKKAAAEAAKEEAEKWAV